MKNCFGNNIRRYRESLNMSQSKFADKINAVLREHDRTFDYTNRSVSKWENGDNMPSLDVVLAISEMTGICLDDLFRDEITEFEKKTVVEEKKSFVRYDVDGPLYDDKYCFITEAIRNIFNSGYTPRGIFYADTVVLQKTDFPTESRGSIEEFGEKLKKNPPIEGLEIDDDFIRAQYTALERMYAKPRCNYGVEIVPLDDLMGLSALRSCVADILHDMALPIFNGKVLVEGQSPFVEDIPGFYETNRINTVRVYNKFADRMFGDGILRAAVHSSIYSTEHAELKRLFKEECPNQLKSREAFFKDISEFEKVDTAYFVYKGCVYAKHSIRIEMPTADYEKLYKEYMSFIDEVELVKHDNLFGDDL